MIKIIKIRGISQMKRNMVRVERRVTDTSDDFAQEMAEVLKRDIRDNWSPTSPSAKGEAPAKLTKNLDSSIIIESQSRAAGGLFAGKEGKYRYITVDTTRGSNPMGRGQYGGQLENEQDRPYMQPAIARVLPLVPTVAKRKIKVR